MPSLRTTASSKIAIGWIAIIGTGLATFVFARNAVIGNRRVLMETRQRIRDQAEKEGAVEFERRRQERETERQTQLS